MALPQRRRQCETDIHVLEIPHLAGYWEAELQAGAEMSQATFRYNAEKAAVPVLPNPIIRQEKAAGNSATHAQV